MEVELDSSPLNDDFDDDLVEHSLQNDTRQQALDDTDTRKDRAAKRIFEGLSKIGPYSKHILNYSYPPLLYQRSEEEDEEEDSQGDQGECDEDEEDLSDGNEDDNSQDLDGDDMGQVPVIDSDDEELLALGDALERATGEKNRGKQANKHHHQNQHDQVNLDDL